MFNLIIKYNVKYLIKMDVFRYVPTRLWGFSGHVQTILYSVFGRVRCPCPKGDRRFLILDDGTTLTYDLFKPTFYEPELGMFINVFYIVVFMY